MDEASAFYQKRFEIKPDDVAACNNLGMAFSQKGNGGRGPPFSSEGLALQPDFALARTNLTKALLQKERP